MLTYYHQHQNVFPQNYLNELQGQILACPYFTTNNLNRDFVGTKGFSVVFRRSHIEIVEQRFPYFKQYLKVALQPECNAFYLNPLLLKSGSRVDPHIDRSLRSYCKTIEPPNIVSVLYIAVPPDIEGGELVLREHKHSIAKIPPQPNTLLLFQGNLTHSVNPVTTNSIRLSLVCEQYNLEETQLWEIPEFQIESRATQQQDRTNKQQTPKQKHSRR
ncbi:2OG-Fe(II) oxygenase [Iningainema tapete]|uniref:2OG-Fe(II) oxygenase n=1 Tax=Iningainema tapete BLCC-T55 TaxID=2748662 RepID=A0A8J6XM51_9CYAN|nr:2OG-Fe(II) oxygenase [Iningainema tapete]MBD2777398.1 2OG-Fe(II) oxygenase [Iningainema tapete BLCC-T55]